MFNRNTVTELHQISKCYQETIYSIDVLYLVKNSIINYLFTNAETQNTSSSVAKIYIFNDYSNFFEFNSTGQVHEAITSHDLSMALPSNFTITAKEDQYYFVGVKSFATTIINYTTTGDLIKYNISSLSPTRCTFPTINCSISLSGGEDVCILAQLQDADKFISLNYTTQSQREYIQTTSSIHFAWK